MTAAPHFPKRVIEAIKAGLLTSYIPYSLRLTRLVDGESTYTLTYSDGTPPIEFDNMDDGYAHIGVKQEEKRTQAVLSALAAEGFAVVPVEPSEAMVDAAYRAHDEYEAKTEGGWCGLASCYRAMIRAAQHGGDDAGK